MGLHCMDKNILLKRNDGEEMITIPLNVNVWAFGAPDIQAQNLKSTKTDTVLYCNSDFISAFSACVRQNISYKSVDSFRDSLFII